MFPYPIHLSRVLRHGDLVVSRAIMHQDGSFLVQFDDPDYIPTGFLSGGFEAVWFIKPRVKVYSILEAAL